MKSSDDCEINGMILAAEQTTIPMPLLLRVVRPKDGSDLWCFIVPYILGCILEDRWLVEKGYRPLDPAPLCTAIPEGPTREKTSQSYWKWSLGLWRSCVHRAIRKYRFTPSPRPTRANDRIDTGWPHRGSGPFAPYPETSAWFAHKLVVSRSFKCAHPDAASSDSSLPLVFTHSDFLPRNLILDEGNRLRVIDVQLSGLYPQWFKYTGVLPTRKNIEYCRWIAAFVAVNY